MGQIDRANLKKLAWLGFSMFLFSQLAAYGIHFGIYWKQKTFVAHAKKVEAKLLDVNPDSNNGYRVKILYPAGTQLNQTTVLMRDPPQVPPGSTLVAYMDPNNLWRVVIPEAHPKISLHFLQLLCAAFTLVFYAFFAMAALATSELLRAPQPEKEPTPSPKAAA